MKHLACNNDSIGHDVRRQRTGAARGQAGHNIRACNVCEAYLGDVVALQHKLLEYKLVECCRTAMPSRDTDRTMLYSTSDVTRHEKAGTAPLPHVCLFEAMGECHDCLRRVTLGTKSFSTIHRG